MKNFFKKLFGDKYPERARKKNRIECVYAGPEEMARRFNRMEKVYAGPPVRDREEDNVMEDVYAGPDPDVDPDDEPQSSPSDKTNPFEGVYRGPEPDTVPEDAPDSEEEIRRAKLREYMKNRRQFETVYAGPSTMPPSEMMAVYAGPAQMQQNSMMMAYAGPAQMQQIPPIGFVYAGPGHFPSQVPANNAQPGDGYSMRGKTPEQIVREGRCHICGEPVNDTQKFCTNCGAPLPRNTTPRTERA